MTFDLPQTYVLYIMSKYASWISHVLEVQHEWPMIEVCSLTVGKNEGPSYQTVNYHERYMY